MYSKASSEVLWTQNQGHFSLQRTHSYLGLQKKYSSATPLLLHGAEQREYGSAIAIATVRRWTKRVQQRNDRYCSTSLDKEGMTVLCLSLQHVLYSKRYFAVRTLAMRMTPRACSRQPLEARRALVSVL